jgi:putative transposase
MRYHCIRKHEGEFPIKMMCRALKVSRSGFYEWRTRAPSARACANERLLSRIREIHLSSRHNYGRVKIWQALRQAGEAGGRHRVARLCQALGIEAKRMRRFRQAYAARHSEPAAPNLLNRDFSAATIDRVWAGDITFIPTREGWLYLAVLIDLYSRKVVGWAMGSKMNRSLVIDALTMAITHRRPAAGLIHHTDQGVVYATCAYRVILARHAMIPSMSRKGDCYDNACVESFFSSLKNELTWHQNFARRDEAKAAIFDYIECFYNPSRLHETLDYVSPVRYEEQRVVP